MKGGWLVGMLVVLSLVGCSGWVFGLERPGEKAVPQSLPEPATTVPPTPTTAAVEVPTKATKAVSWARADLAERLKVSVEQVRLVAVEYVEWSDASLGCPKPGMMYAQVITPGYKVVFEAGGERYEYHSAVGSDRAVLCEPGKPLLPGLPVTRPPSGDR